MKKFLTVLCLYVAISPVYGATDCLTVEYVSGEDMNKYIAMAGFSDMESRFYHCGEYSKNNNGCPVNAVVYGKRDDEIGFYRCKTNGGWQNITNEIPFCLGDPVTEDDSHADVWRIGEAIFFCDFDEDYNVNDIYGNSTYRNICKISISKINQYLVDCEPTGGERNDFSCWCSDPYENDGPYKCKLKPTKFNYKSCSSDSDCTNIDNTVRPYLHSTAWHCAWQSAGVRVCTATACESGWTPINGYCQEDKTAQTPQSENKNANSVSNIKTETKAGTKKPCTDLDNMDSNCKCIVAGTVERNGTCVCSDSNKVIKNGKCEWTAKYVAGLESNLDSKFNSLTATIGGFEKNVWRDENGEFNTARLASDSIAGVVLGTVGGIVTANLVKKAQVKQGFEDIGCYIGGQSVAGYGDEFNVGR